MKFKTENLKRGIAGLLLLLFPMFGNAEDGYKLVCDEPVFKFGHVDQSAVITNVFTIRNQGDMTFPLKFINTSCSCTKGRLDKRMIGPGETAKLTAVYKAIRRKGPQKKTLKVLSMLSDTPAIMLYLEGFVDVP